MSVTELAVVSVTDTAAPSTLRLDPEALSVRALHTRVLDVTVPVVRRLEPASARSVDCVRVTVDCDKLVNPKL